MWLWFLQFVSFMTKYTTRLSAPRLCSNSPIVYWWCTKLSLLRRVPFGFPRYPEFFEAPLICAKHSTLPHPPSVEDIERVRNRLSPIWASTSLGSARCEIQHLWWPFIQAREKFAESVDNTRGPTAVLSELKQVGVLSAAPSVFNQLSQRAASENIVRISPAWQHRGGFFFV